MERIRKEKEMERAEKVKGAKEDGIKHALAMKKKVLRVNAAVAMSLDHATDEARKIAAAKHEMESQSEMLSACSCVSCGRSSNLSLTPVKPPMQFMTRLPWEGAG